MSTRDKPFLLAPTASANICLATSSGRDVYVHVHRTHTRVRSGNGHTVISLTRPFLQFKHWLASARRRIVRERVTQASHLNTYRQLLLRLCICISSPTDISLFHVCTSRSFARARARFNETIARHRRLWRVQISSL